MQEKNKKKEVMVYAYTHYNLGDDLLMKILCDRYPETVFHLYTYPEYAYVLESCKNIRIHSNQILYAKIVNAIGRKIGQVNLFERFLAKKSNACVCITGSLFIQGGENWKPYLEYMKSRKLDDIPYFQIGSNFGPYTDLEFFKGFKELFAGYTDICFREKHSFELFSELHNVRVAPDIVLSGDYQRYTLQPKEKRVACSVIDLSDRADLMRYKDNYLDAIVNLCKKYLSEGYVVDLLSFCKMEGDENAISEIEKQIDNPRLIHHRYCTDTNLEEMLDCIGKAEIVIASRFHAMILGWCMKKKTFPVIYSPKMKNVIDDFKYYGASYDILAGLTLDLTQMNLESFDISEFSKEAERQFEVLDQFLKVHN